MKNTIILCVKDIFVKNKIVVRFNSLLKRCLTNIEDTLDESVTELRVAAEQFTYEEAV